MRSWLSRPQAGGRVGSRTYLIDLCPLSIRRSVSPSYGCSPHPIVICFKHLEFLPFLARPSVSNSKRVQHCGQPTDRQSLVRDLAQASTAAKIRENSSWAETWSAAGSSRLQRLGGDSKVGKRRFVRFNMTSAVCLLWCVVLLGSRVRAGHASMENAVSGHYEFLARHFSWLQAVSMQAGRCHNGKMTLINSWPINCRAQPQPKGVSHFFNFFKELYCTVLSQFSQSSQSVQKSFIKI